MKLYKNVILKVSAKCADTFTPTGESFSEELWKEERFLGNTPNLYAYRYAESTWNFPELMTSGKFVKKNTPANIKVGGRQQSTYTASAADISVNLPISVEMEKEEWEASSYEAKGWERRPRHTLQRGIVYMNNASPALALEWAKVRGW